MLFFLAAATMLAIQSRGDIAKAFLRQACCHDAENFGARIKLEIVTYVHLCTYVDTHTHAYTT